jgi:hypothetical protein
VRLTLLACVLGVPLVGWAGEDALGAGDIDRFVGFRGMTDAVGELTERPLSCPPMAFKYD